MHTDFESSWKEVLKEEFQKPYFADLMRTVRKEYRTHKPVYPPLPFVFNAFSVCPFDAIKVVILGQDPYHGEGQAHGLCFSVPDEVRIPPSLKNIFKELQNDLGIPLRTHGNLTHWAEQGVFLFNTTLTVRDGAPNSHKDIGWETFTNAVIQKISNEKEHVVFLLWGNNAQKKSVFIDTTKHLILTAPHPSPFSARSGFFGSKHFSMTNTYLKQNKKTPIVW
ncbi:uracil-DNA glycosylase [Candidatus Kaiserbacteria bacterium]|nr:MAG: uracil-DNA glycosylase [Candidatus Kaiserbacteria bacterium]